MQVTKDERPFLMEFIAEHEFDYDDIHNEYCCSVCYMTHSYILRDGEWVLYGKEHKDDCKLKRFVDRLNAI